MFASEFANGARVNLPMSSMPTPLFGSRLYLICRRFPHTVECSLRSPLSLSSLWTLNTLFLLPIHLIRALDLQHLPAPKPPAELVRKFKTKDKSTKRGLTGAESAEKERQIAEAIEAKKRKKEEAAAKKLEKEKVATEKAAEKKRIVTEKAIIAAAKVVEKEKVKKAQEMARIAQEEAEIVRRAEEALHNAIEV
jgi:hypothetical protein